MPRSRPRLPIPGLTPLWSRGEPRRASVRDVLYLEAELRAGRVVAVRLLHTSDDDVIAKSSARSRERAMRDLHAAFVQWARTRKGERLDSPMPWVPAERLCHPSGVWRHDPVSFPRRYRFERGAPGESGAWVRVAGTGERSWEVGPGHR